jgi:WhiB family transcriptional regulator, redox-sensing transcriptional regulator
MAAPAQSDLRTASAINGAPDASDDAWTAHALCRTGNGELTRVFFADSLSDIARARAICAQCPVMLPCLEGAVARREPGGVWGGQLFSAGRILTGKRRQGRPSAKPGPEDQMPDIPVPVHLRSFLRTA